MADAPRFDRSGRHALRQYHDDYARSASGSGKSEMLEYVHRQEDGRLLLGKNLVTGEQRRLVLNQACGLHPVTDDMAMCHPEVQNRSGYCAYDAEQAWFVRVDHIQQYGTDPHLEELTVHSREPLIFLNLRGVPKATCLIWEHTEDAPGVPCPNPRVILPRRFVPNVVNETVEVMIRNFGVRTPPCTSDCPTYGILGYLHILPPALAWLWRLVAPRGHANPSITDNAGLASEGVGSYWPFATGRFVDHANLLLRQIQQTPKVRYSLTPNQHVAHGRSVLCQSGSLASILVAGESPGFRQTSCSQLAAHSWVTRCKRCKSKGRLSPSGCCAWMTA